MTDVFPHNGGLHWHLDAYGKLPIINASASSSYERFNYPPVQKWTHIVAVWDNEVSENRGAALLYVDGQKRGEIKTDKQDMFLTVQNLEIGTAWGGAIDELMVFDKPLSKCQVDKIYSAGTLCDDKRDLLACPNLMFEYDKLKYLPKLPMGDSVGKGGIFTYTEESFELHMASIDKHIAGINQRVNACVQAMGVKGQKKEKASVQAPEREMPLAQGSCETIHVFCKRKPTKRKCRKEDFCVWQSKKKSCRAKSSA